MRKIILGTLVCLIVAAGAGYVAAAKAKPASNPQATVAFLNASTDNIQGDGSPYQGGVSGVVSEFQPGATPDGSWTGPTNLLLNITITSSKPKRFLLYKYPEAAKIDLSSEVSSSPYPCGYFTGSAGPTSGTTGVKVAGYMNVHSLGQMQVGEARSIRIHFGADSGQFLWLSPHNVSTGSCSSTAIVFRQTQTTWYVASDIARIPNGTSLPGVRFDTTDNVYEVLGTDPSWWDRPSAVSQLNAGPSLGNYVMPFALTVSCPTCPPPPPCPTGKATCSIQS